MIHLVERLRCFEHPNQTGEALMQEAANRIEELEAAIRFMRDNFKDNPISSFNHLFEVLGDE